MTERQRLRAIHLLLVQADLRLPDETRTAEPYEVTDTELRDIDRLALGEAPRTRIGRAALLQAREER